MKKPNAVLIWSYLSFKLISYIMLLDLIGLLVLYAPHVF